MKNAYVIILTISALFSLGLKAQTQTSSPPVVITDTLHYYFNKFYFKTGISNVNTYPYYKCPAATSTAVSHLGSRFDVPPGETVTVTGLEAFARKGPITPDNWESSSATVKVGLYLCNLNAQGLPVLPAIDSVHYTLGSIHMQSMNLVGGNFQDSHSMTNSFAVLFRNLSTTSSDSVRLLRTTGLTPTASAASGTNQCSDGGYGFVRFSGQFYQTRNFNYTPPPSLMSSFGIGTDYEFVVAPRVTYTVQSSQIMPEKVYLVTNTVTLADTMCTRLVLTFTNTSSGFFQHQMYNLNHFALKWSLTSTFQAQPLTPGGFTQDSAITWRFEAYDLTGYPDERVFLPYVNNGTVSFQTARRSSLDPPTYCYMTNQFRTRLRPMSIYGRMPMHFYDENFKMCLKYCNDADGVNETQGFEDLRTFPNPPVNGKTNINGLRGKNTLYVYDISGRLITRQECTGSQSTINLEDQKPGIYFVKIFNVDHNSSVSIKLLR